MSDERWVAWRLHRADSTMHEYAGHFRLKSAARKAAGRGGYVEPDIAHLTDAQYAERGSPKSFQEFVT